MSITFRIDAFDRPRELLDSFECICVDEGPVATCTECNGTGLVEFWGDPFDLNMSNSNAYRVMNDLHIDTESCGETTADNLIRRLHYANRSGRNIHRCYALMDLAREAERLNAKILWS